MYVTFDAAAGEANADPRPAGSRFRLNQSGRAAATDRKRVEQDLRQALLRDQFTLHYQPRIALDRGLQVGAEASIRWPHRKRGMISPSASIAIAERSELMTQIGAWALNTACCEASSWCNNNIVWVSIAQRQLESENLADQVGLALEMSGLPPERLGLQFSEGMLLNVSMDTLLTLSAIRDLGVGLVLDDFGGLHGSLAMLRRLPMTVLKLHQTLTHNLPHDREDAAIVLAVTGAARALDITVVAAGVETEQQRAFLSGIGCNEAQGHLFSTPLTGVQVGRHAEML
jgi:EAL domain-containing protein (putative c-di-GMP-specific phosphodiesterase class I)